MRSLERVLIVGASAAGLAAAETLRSGGFQGTVTIVGDEPHRPYDRPPLSKQVLNDGWGVERIALRSDTDLASLDVEWRLGCKAVQLDLQAREVRLADERRLPFDALLLATGVAPRGLPGQELQGVHFLRTLDDAVAFRARIRQGGRLLVLGAGFLGTECAAAARGAGMEVILAYPERVPLERAFGERVGAMLADLHRERGVTLRPDAFAQRIVGEGGRAIGVRFRDGSECRADLILVAIGSVPATGWLQGSGLATEDGIVCDRFCQAAPGVYAAGDVCRWFNPLLAEHVRVEHRMNATDQGAAAARNLLGAQAEFAPISFAWSDQYSERLQAYGHFPADADVDVTALQSGRRKCVATFKRNGQLTGVLGWNAARELRELRGRLLQPARVSADPVRVSQ
ncbi:MAG: NAD(P)/FAD-dependent oxidoreductase [Lautropia sp.]